MPVKLSIEHYNYDNVDTILDPVIIIIIIHNQWVLIIVTLIQLHPSIITILNPPLELITTQKQRPLQQLSQPLYLILASSSK